MVIRMNYVPLVHIAVYHGVIHGVGHGKPVDAQVDVLDDDDDDDNDDDDDDGVGGGAFDGDYNDIDLYVVGIVDGWVDIGSDEVGVVGQPAHQEQGHHPHHHLHHLGDEDVADQEQGHLHDHPHPRHHPHLPHHDDEDTFLFDLIPSA